MEKMVYGVLMETESVDQISGERYTDSEVTNCGGLNMARKKLVNMVMEYEDHGGLFDIGNWDDFCRITAPFSKTTFTSTKTLREAFGLRLSKVSMGLIGTAFI